MKLKNSKERNTKLRKKYVRGLEFLTAGFCHTTHPMMFPNLCQFIRERDHIIYDVHTEGEGGGLSKRDDSTDRLREFRDKSGGGPKPEKFA